MKVKAKLSRRANGNIGQWRMGERLRVDMRGWPMYNMLLFKIVVM